VYPALLVNLHHPVVYLPHHSVLTAQKATMRHSLAQLNACNALQAAIQHKWVIQCVPCARLAAIPHPLALLPVLIALWGVIHRFQA
jgi:hypothetical protein